MAVENDRRIQCAFGAWKSPIQLVLLAFGVWFTFGNYVAGTAIWPSTITDPNAMHVKDVFGFIPVMINGWHLYFHLVTGLFCLRFSTRPGAATAALVLGAVYVVVGALGLLIPGDILGFIMADTFGNWVHIVEGVGLLAAALAALRTKAGAHE